MLVMRRRAGERFKIGDDIEIEFLEVSGTRVKLGIVAPESLVVLRMETEITREENLTAASSVKPEVISSLLHQLNRPQPTPGISAAPSKR